MTTIKVKPLSTNAAWQGRRFKTPGYTAFEKEVLLKLKPMKLPKSPFKLTLQFGFSNKASDVDNPIKMVMDVLAKKYRFNDREVYELSVTKHIVAKGKEYFSYEITAIN